jgi:hypothetical protein
MSEYKKEEASHILQSAANLIGVCLIIITGLKVSGVANTSILDKVATISSVFLLVSIISAYLSMRHTVSSIVRYRDTADYSFILGIVLLVITIVAMSLNIIQ